MLTLRVPALALAAAVLAAPAFAADPPKPDPRYQWDMSILFESAPAWEAERKAIEAELPAIAALQGTLGQSAKSLAAALDNISALSRRFERLSVFASATSDVDTRDAAAQERDTQAKT